MGGQLPAGEGGEVTGKVTVLTPTVSSGAIELGRKMYRKQILPIGELPYKGRKLQFTPDYINNLVAAFKDGAFDAVPFQLAPDDNSHSNAVDRAAGEIVGLEAGEDGLYATVSATERGAAILDEHPNLAVSVRVVEGYERNDGKTSREYPAALQHVLATWAPRIAGMKPWEPINCSEETDEVMDLSALTFTPDGDAKEDSANSAITGGETTKGAPVAQLTEEELAAVRAMAESGEAREIRRAKRIRLSEMADTIGVGSSTLAHWESGDRNPTGEGALRWLAVLRRLASAAA